MENKEQKKEEYRCMSCQRNDSSIPHGLECPKRVEEPITHLPPIVPKPQSKKKFSKSTVIIIVVSILLLIAAGYIVNKEIVEPKLLERNQGYYTQGAIDLYNNLISELTTCNQVPLKLNNNQTVNAILVECLQR